MTIKPATAFIIFILIVFIPLFAHLDASPLAEWDESHLAGNAMEMYYNHNWIVTMNDNRPDMWQTKPPLMIWLQVISMKILGVNELAVRLPSAIAALGTCLMLFFFFTKKYKAPLLALLSVAVLVTSDGFIHSHAARNGEYDVLLTMLMTGYSLFYFLYLEEASKKYIYGTFILLILASLTKGVQSLLFLPGLFFYTIYKKKLFIILKQKELYIGIVGFVFFVIGYYLLRDHYNPGYIKTVWANELGGRYTSAIEGHDSYPLIYYDFLKTQFSYWYLLVLPGILYGIYSNQKWLKDLTVFITILTAIYFLILSNAKTAVFWYSLPAYPFLSVLVAIFIYTIFNALADIGALKKKFPLNILPFVFIIVIFFAPYTKVKDLALAPPEGFGRTTEIKNMEMLLQDVLHNRININGYAIADPGNEQQLEWYFRLFNYQHRPVTLIDDKDLVPNSMVLAFKPESKKFIEDHYNTQVTQTYYKSVTAYKLFERK